ncbi:hypothetical protein GCM10009839_04140 [Catenulispora yoronensis]|uniref:Secreted protein/lipoprotein n=1 Tax=Catenulispora yoronensis TaxID=450799 RepID=A0ABN2TM65_9ACTN
MPGDPSIAAAMTAFQNYTAVIHDMGVKAHDSNDLAKYADGTVLSLMNDFVAQERRLSVNQQGTETVKVTDAKLDSAAKPPVVTITTCTDDTKFFLVFATGAKKGQPAQTPNKTAYPNVYKVHLGADGKWRVNAVTPESKKTC